MINRLNYGVNLLLPNVSEALIGRAYESVLNSFGNLNTLFSNKFFVEHRVGHREDLSKATHNVYVELVWCVAIRNFGVLEQVDYHVEAPFVSENVNVA